MFNQLGDVVILPATRSKPVRVAAGNWPELEHPSTDCLVADLHVPLDAGFLQMSSSRSREPSVKRKYGQITLLVISG
jgi:hypothetical protein